METRLEYIEGLIGDSADKHVKEIAAAKERMKDLHSAIQSCVKADHHMSLEQRLTEYDQRHMSTEERVDGMERKMNNDGEHHSRKLSALELNHGKVKTAHDELNNFLHGEKTLRELSHTKLEERLFPVERCLEGVVDKQAKELEAATLRIRELHDKLQQSKANIDSHKVATDQRLIYIENIMVDSTNNKIAEFGKDIDARFVFMLEDQKRARDVLESSLQEQLRLEHSARDAQAAQQKEIWERELKNRQAYQENYKDLLTQERSAKELIEHNFLSRMSQCEQTIAHEAQRLWSAIDGHTHETLVQQDSAPAQAPRPGPIKVSVPATNVVLQHQSPRIVPSVIREQVLVPNVTTASPPVPVTTIVPNVTTASPGVPVGATVLSGVPSPIVGRMQSSSSASQLPVVTQFLDEKIYERGGSLPTSRVPHHHNGNYGHDSRSPSASSRQKRISGSEFNAVGSLPGSGRAGTHSSNSWKPQPEVTSPAPWRK
jgi:hypothetical protein